MNALEEFLVQQFPVPGIVAAAMRLPDGRVLARCDGDALTSAQVEKAIHRLGLAAESFRRHRLEARTLCWTFERACLHLARRPDGALLALFATRGAAAPGPGEVARLLARFTAAPG